jgi:hypothetical protein
LVQPHPNQVKLLGSWGNRIVSLSDIVASERLQASFGEPDEETGSRPSLALVASVLLHGLALALVVLLVPFGMQGREGYQHFLPVEVVEAGIEARGGAAPRSGAETQSEARTAPSVPSGADLKPVDGDLSPDPLQAKLQALATLSQPSPATDSDERSAGTPSLVVTTDDAAPGQFDAVKDFIRVQVERHWSPDLPTLGQNDFAVPIRVDVARDGTVLKAEIVDTARSSDPIYREIASSARNAILLASPLSLPPTTYSGVMHLVLYLNPKDTLH